MAIVVFNGNDFVSSRQAYLTTISQAREQGKEVIRLAGKELDEETLKLSLQSESLFGHERLLAIDGLLTGPPSRILEKMISLLARAPDRPVLFWEEGKVAKDTRGRLPKGTVFRDFKLPKTLFCLLDGLTPDRPEENLPRLFQTAEEVEPNYLLLMLARQMRLLILAKEKSLSSLPVWQKSKLDKQAEKFTLAQLSKQYTGLADIDYEQKTSGGTASLAKALEQFIIDL